MSVKRLIGIDFGTSSTYLKVKHYENNKPVREDGTSVQYVDFNGNAWVPSIIQKLGDDFWYGYDAQTKKADSAVIYRNFKMSLEHKDEKARNEAMHLTELFFSYIFHMYQDQFTYSNDNYDEVETIVSYPVKWKEETIKFLADAAKKAGFQNVKTMDEPTAALNAVLIQNTSGIMKIANMQENKPSYIMMIDMGAGTTDLAILKCSVGKDKDGSGIVASKIVSTWPRGNNQLYFGGREVEEKLYDYLLKYLSSMPNVTKSTAQNLLNHQMDNIKSWKENTVSSTLNKEIEVSNCPFLTPVVPLITEDPIPFPGFGRKQFEKEFSEYLESFVALINGCIDDTKENISEFSGMKDIELVILTGGHSQWYFVRDILDGTIKTIGNTEVPPMIKDKDRIFSLPRPQETVSLGLVYSPMRLELNSEEEPLIEFDNADEKHSYVWFDRRIYKVDKKGEDIPLHLKWIEVKDEERPDSMLSIINKKYGLTLSSYHYYICCFCKQFMIMKIYVENKINIIRVNLDVAYPNPEIIYKSGSSMVDVVSYGGVLYVVEASEEKNAVSQLSLDGTKKKFLFDLRTIERKLGESVCSEIKYADDKYIYTISRYDKTKESIVQLKYNQKPVMFRIMDDVKHEPNVLALCDNFYLQGKNIYYYNETDGICAMNCESKQKRCLLNGKYILWGVSEKRLIFSEVVMDSYVGLYGMNLDGSNKKLIVNNTIDRAKVVGEWVVFLRKISAGGRMGALIENFLINFPGEPYCVRTDGTGLNKLL